MTDTTDLAHIIEDLRPLAVEIDTINVDPHNTRDHPDQNIRAVAQSLAKYGQRKPVVVNRDGNLIEAGNGTWRAAKRLGWKQIAAVFVEDDPHEALGYAIADNRTAEMAYWNNDMLMAAFEAIGDPFGVPGIDAEFIREIATAAEMGDTGASPIDDARKTLAERFIVPPFSVLDARQGYWRQRKQAWIDLGLKPELGRGTALLFRSETVSLIDFYARKRDLEAEVGHRLNVEQTIDLLVERGVIEDPDRNRARCFGQDLMKGENPNFGHKGALYNAPLDRDKAVVRTGPDYGYRSTPPHGPRVTQNPDGTLHYEPTRGTSIFDPVLCEVAYRWFMPDGGHVLDPFAGESTKGVVAAYLGYPYTGVELRQEQVDENEYQWIDISHRLTDVKDAVPVKISAKCARETWNGCELDYIASTCHGSCCQTSKGDIHIPILERERPEIMEHGGTVVDGMLQAAGGGGCVFQGADGLCRLHEPGIKPFACTLSPFTLNDSNTLIVKNRNRKLACYGEEPKAPTYKAYGVALVNLFGHEEAERIERKLDAGSGDFLAYMPVERFRDVKLCIARQRASLGMGNDGKYREIKMGSMPAPLWIRGDSANLCDILPDDAMYDLVFTSPPYYDLEVYSEQQEDGSALETYEEFMGWYADVFRQAVERLRDNRFLVVKVGEIRDKRTGIYRNFVGDNLACFRDMGLHYYNEIILVTTAGSLPVRVGRQFESGRKVGKTHQNILVFYKGDDKAIVDQIREEFPAEIEYADLAQSEED